MAAPVSPKSQNTRSEYQQIIRKRDELTEKMKSLIAASLTFHEEQLADNVAKLRRLGPGRTQFETKIVAFLKQREAGSLDPETAKNFLRECGGSKVVGCQALEVILASCLVPQNEISRESREFWEVMKSASPETISRLRGERLTSLDRKLAEFVEKKLKANLSTKTVTESFPNLSGLPPAGLVSFVTLRELRKEEQWPPIFASYQEELNKNRQVFFEEDPEKKLYLRLQKLVVIDENGSLILKIRTEYQLPSKQPLDKCRKIVTMITSAESVIQREKRSIEEFTQLSEEAAEIAQKILALQSESAKEKVLREPEPFVDFTLCRRGSSENLRYLYPRGKDLKIAAKQV